MRRPGCLFRAVSVTMLMFFLISVPSLVTADVVSGKVVSDDTLEQDWGWINIMGGILQHTFTLTNGGQDNLILKGGFTSCGCTNIIITLPDGSKSPVFTMTHSNTAPPANWVGIVKPGENFKVTVDYDPLTHGPNALGPVERRAYIISSAPEDGRLSVKLPAVRNGTVTILRVSGVVVSEETYKQKEQKD